MKPELQEDDEDVEGNLPKNNYFNGRRQALQ